MGLSDEDRARHAKRREWPALRDTLVRRFREKTRQEWCAILEGTDACFAPVLTFEEAPSHPHNAQRSTFVTVDGVLQPSAAPRFDRSTPEATGGVPAPGAETEPALRDWGFAAEEIAALREAGAIR